MSLSEAQRAQISTTRGVNPPSAQVEGVEYYNRRHNDHHFVNVNPQESIDNGDNNVVSSDNHNEDNNNNVQNGSVIDNTVEEPINRVDNMQNHGNNNNNNDNDNNSVSDSQEIPPVNNRVPVDVTPEDAPDEHTNDDVCIVCSEVVNRRNRFNMRCARAQNCAVKICGECASRTAFASWIRGVNPLTRGNLACPCCRNITNIPVTYVMPRLEPRALLIMHYLTGPQMYGSMSRRFQGMLRQAFRNREEIDPEFEVRREYDPNFVHRQVQRAGRQNAGGRNPQRGVVDNVPPPAPVNVGAGRNVNQHVNEQQEPESNEQREQAPVREQEFEHREGGGPQLQHNRNVGLQEPHGNAVVPRPQLPRPGEVVAPNPVPQASLQIPPRGDDEVDMSIVEPATLYTEHNWFSATCGNRSQYMLLVIFCWFYIANYNGETWGQILRFIYVGAADGAEGLIGGEIGRRVHNTIIFAIIWFHFVVLAWVYNVYRHKERGYVGALQFPSRFRYGTPTEVNLIGVRIQLYENPNALKYSGVNKGLISGAGPQIYGNAARAIYSTIRAGSVAHDSLARFINADLARLVGPDADPVKLACTALYLEQWIEVGNDVFRTGGDRIPNMRY